MNTNAQAVAERIDLIISHVVDGEATPQEWSELDSLASGEPRLWRALAQAQRDAGALRAALSSAALVADRVSLPSAARDRGGRDAPEIHSFPHPPLRLNRLGAWTGWAAAAIITVIAAVALRGQGVAGPLPDAASIGGQLVNSRATSADAWNEYLNLGRQDGTVLGEMPGRVLLESRPVPEGRGFEVVFIRQVMERRVVPDLYEVTGRDEAGQPTLAPVRTAVRGTM